MPEIDLESAVEALRTGDGSGVRIAVLDSGVEIGHPRFVGRRLRDDLCVEADVSVRCLPGNGQDNYGHGTAVAGLIWDEASCADIGSFAVLGPSLSGRTQQVAAAARQAIASGYHILNCSFACGLIGHLGVYKEWLDEAFLAGVHVVAASGNHRLPEWPAHFSSVLGVDCGVEVDPLSLSRVPGRMVEFSYPGENLRVAWKNGEERQMTGSSFAAARFSGMLARLLSVYPTCDVLTAKILLRRIAARERNLQPPV